ncbi:MAG TPA: hypothetical protein VHR44_02715 [Beijerinckiaceae bacterium]|nr:hypothetical protein [Beijerinckiaceae bacterium]
MTANLFDARVAAKMSVMVVVALEVIHVDHDGSDLREGTFPQILQSLVQAAAIQEAGQLVVAAGKVGLRAAQAFVQPEEIGASLAAVMTKTAHDGDVDADAEGAHRAVLPGQLGKKMNGDRIEDEYKTCDEEINPKGRPQGPAEEQHVEQNEILVVTGMLALRGEKHEKIL